jgi:Secretion system C-terminal sorting domain
MKKGMVWLFFSLMLSFQGIAQTVTEVFYPQYIQGVGTSNPSDDRKVPFVCRMTLNGLTPNATYRYYSRFVQDPSVVSNNGQGFYILANPSGNFTRVTSATLATAGRYGEFTTNGSGSFTGWFIVEPSSAIDYEPGRQLYWRIMLNNGAGGGSVASRLTATNPVTVLGWGATPTTGTGLRSTAISSFNARNFVLLFDNDAGTGRPVAGTFVESDGTDNNSTTSGYAPFYASNVDAVDKAWGTIIPNNLANGIRRICQYELSTGNSLGCINSTNGVFPAASGGNLTTVNTNGGLTELVLNGPLLISSLPVSLLSFDVNELPGNMAKLEWRTATESNFARFEIEKSKDGNQFIFLGNKNAKGSNSMYSFDDILTPGNNYYRLKIVDVDGGFKYSKILVVTKDVKAQVLSVFPNPVKSNMVIVHGKAVSGATIEVFGTNGSRLLQLPVQQGSVQTTIDVSRLTTGNYILTYHNEGGKQNLQFKKQ